MKAIKYIIYKEGEYYISQCLNVDVASFGDTHHTVSHLQPDRSGETVLRRSRRTR